MMASIIPHKSGGYRAMVYVEGQRATKVLPSERAAKNWAAAKETEFRLDTQKTTGEKFTLLDALQKYVASDKIAERDRERKRFITLINNASSKEYNFPLHKKMADLDTSDFTDWRDARLKKVKPNTFLRELSCINSMMNVARKEWKWIKKNPLTDLSRPEEGMHRTTLVTWTQIKKMLQILEYSPSGKIEKSKQVAAMMFLVSLRTGMRRAELVRMKWKDVKADHVHLPKTKTVPRDVPLEDKAKRLIEKMRGYEKELVFGLSARSFENLFYEAKIKSGWHKDFTFHDSRHTAATWMAKRLDVLTLCKMFGWSNPQQAMTYYNPTAADVAKMLSAKRSANQSR